MSEMPPQRLIFWTIFPQLVTLFCEAVESLGNRASVTEAGHQGYATEGYIVSLIPRSLLLGLRWHKLPFLFTHPYLHELSSCGGMKHSETISQNKSFFLWVGSFE